MKNLLEYILIRLVEYPEEIKITETVEDNGTILFTVNANEADYGRIIGKGGAVISAIRNIIRVRAVKEGKRAIIKVDAASPEGDDVQEETVIAVEEAPLAETPATEADVTVSEVTETTEEAAD